jgi:hypothetical protein
MTTHPEERRGSKMARRFLAVGLTLAMGYTSGLFALGGCGGASRPWNGQLPESVVDKLTDCGKQGPKPLQRVEHALVFNVVMDVDSHVEEVELTDSTLHLPEVEACMVQALYGLSASAEALPLRRRKLESRVASAQQARPLLGQLQVVQVAEVVVLIGFGYLTYTVVVHYLVTRNHTKPRPHPPAPQTDEPPKPEPPKPEPQTGSDPKTTDPPPPPPPSPPARRYPNQTCENDVLDALEADKKKLCYSGYAAACSGNHDKPKFAKIPCSAIQLAIQQRLACKAARQLVQDKCFGGKSDAGHKKAIDQEQDGIDNCEALKLLNCAKGHPMAGK